MNFKGIIDETRDLRNKKVVSIESIEDFDLLKKRKDIIRVKRTNYSGVAPEEFLYITKGKNNLFLWGTGYSNETGECGRVIKIPLNELKQEFLKGSVEVPDYKNGPFFKLKEKSHYSLKEVGLVK